MPFLSVMIPVYNGEELVRDAIEAILNQPCKDLELIIMDDGSTDTTAQICNEYEKKDDRVKVYSHTNVGLGKNRNMGFKYLRGKYTIFVDHDDLIVNDFYTEEMKAFLQECNKRSIEVVIPARIRANMDLTTCSLDNVFYDGIINGGNNPSWKLPYEFATMIYSTRLLIDNTILFSENRPEMESIFRHKAVYCAKKVLFTNKLFFAIRRDNEQSIVHNWNFEQVSFVRLKEYHKLLLWHKNFNKEDSEVVEDCINYLDGIAMEMIKNHVKSASILNLNKDNFYHKMFIEGYYDKYIDNACSNKVKKVVSSYKLHPKLYAIYKISSVPNRIWNKSRKLIKRCLFSSTQNQPIKVYEKKIKELCCNKIELFKLLEQ